MLAKSKNLKSLCFIITVLLSVPLFSQESLKSANEDYYEFLSLTGLTGRPTLNYRTLSDSVWKIDGDAAHPWKNQNLGTSFRLFGKMYLRPYGPELFTSFNTAAPYGQNDGALWQGKGINSSFTGGARLEGYGVEATFKPQVSFSQNTAFDYIKPAYSGNVYNGKGAVYGYYGVPSIDAPQRFGNSPFFTFDWGDSEIRYTWKTLTVGFGTQPIWLGPAQLNPIIHSNNAPSYPKLDLGLRKQGITIPRLNWYIGALEARAWWGYLSESPYFDNDGSNDHNLITGLALAYSFPGFLEGLTIGFNRIMLSKWNEMNYKAVFTLLVPVMKMTAGADQNDQRASLVIDYLFPKSGFDIYLEWARNDYSTGDNIIRYPFHTVGYTAGIKKSLSLPRDLKGEILLEITDLDCSQDYDRLINWYSTFYAHHVITQGHTNSGQWLGAGIGTGGNSQYLGFKLYFPRGFGQFFVQRRNPDLDYTWFIDTRNYPKEGATAGYAERNIRTFLDFGLSGLYGVTPDISVYSSIVFRNEYNPLNHSEPVGNIKSAHRYNFYLSLGFKYAI
jgi:hypothetical protein